MPRGRIVAVMVDADQMGFREEAMLRGVRRVAEGAGWRLVLDYYAVHQPPEGCAGIIAPPRRYAGRHFREARVPVVCIGWTRIPVGTARVLENRYEAGRVAARHLVEQGYQSFGYLGFTRNAASRMERYYCRKELHRIGRRMHSVRTFSTYTSKKQWWTEVKAALDAWLRRLAPPVGILVARPGFARALADRALALGLRIPADVGIVAADDFPPVCELSPPLTSLRFDYAEQGYRAATILQRVMRGIPPPEESILLPPKLVPRASTDLLSVGDPVVADALWVIDSHRTEPLSPADVARAVGVGERALQRRFRAAGRDTVVQEIAKARVEHAKGEIERTLSPLPAVAYHCGFRSYAAFARAFKRHTGVPPSQWPRRVQHEGRR